MARLTLIDPASATGKAKTLLDAVKAKLGLVPNMTRVMASSPATLEAYLNFSGALSHGELSPKLREQLAIVLAEVNNCDYCLSAHTTIGKMVGLTPAELESAREGGSSEAKTVAALKFAKRVIATKGEISDTDVKDVRAAGYTDGQIAEIIAQVGLNIFTNYFNKATGVAVDKEFGHVAPRALAGAGAR